MKDLNDTNIENVEIEEIVFDEVEEIVEIDIEEIESEKNEVKESEILEFEEVSLEDEIENKKSEDNSADIFEEEMSRKDKFVDAIVSYYRKAFLYIMKFLNSKYAWVVGIASFVMIVVISFMLILLTTENNKALTANSNEQETTNPQAQAVLAETVMATKQMPLMGMRLEAVADEDSIVARILNEKGDALSGYEFIVKLLDGSLEDNKKIVDKAIEEQKEKASRNSDVSEKSSEKETVTLSKKEEDLLAKAKSYKDDDKDGEVVIKDLKAGTYTLMVEAEAGFDVPDATEATIVKFEVIDNILEQVVAQDEATEKEDPQAEREADIKAQAAVEVTMPVPVATLPSVLPTLPVATTQPASLTVLPMANGQVIYKVNNHNRTIGYNEVKNYINDDNIKTVYLNDGTSIKGYVFRTENVFTANGMEAVITELLIEKKDNVAKAIEIKDVLYMENSTAAAPSTVAPSTAAQATTVPATVTQTTEATKTVAQTTAAPSTTPQTTKAQATVAAQKVYYIYELDLANVNTTQTSTNQAVTTAPDTDEKITIEGYNGWYVNGGNMYYLKNGNALTGWHWLSGLNYYFNASGKLSSSLVIDVSAYNGNINWNAVKATGVNDVFIRVGYRGWGSAKIVQDKMFVTNVSGAKAAGLNVGGYFVTQAINTAEAVEEASFIVAAAKNYGLNLPLVIDVEWAGSGSEQGRGNYISASERTAVINAFSETVSNSGYTPMVYASKAWFTSQIKSASIVPYAKIWVAQYADIDETTYGGRYDMWQFRSDGAVNGISGNVDISAWKK